MQLLRCCDAFPYVDPPSFNPSSPFTRHRELHSVEFLPRSTSRGVVKTISELRWFAPRNKWGFAGKIARDSSLYPQITPLRPSALSFVQTSTHHWTASKLVCPVKTHPFSIPRDSKSISASTTVDLARIGISAIAQPNFFQQQPPSPPSTTTLC